MSLTWLKSKHDIDIQTPLNTFSVFSGTEIKKVIIAMHGYGDNGQNSAQLADAFDIENVLFLFLEGPLEVPLSYGGRHWFDLFHEPHQNIETSAKQILDLFKNLTETHKIPSEKIYFFGFSQGAAMAMYCGLQTKQPLGGIIAVSGFLVHTAQLLAEQNSLYKECPLLLLHGEEDQTIFPILFFEAQNIFKYMGFQNIKTQLYKIGHTISYEQVEEMKKFLENTSK